MDSCLLHVIYWQSKYDVLSALCSCNQPTGSGSLKTRDNTWACAELGRSHVHLGSKNGAFGSHLGDALCCYKFDHSSFTLPSELKEIHMEALRLGKHLLFNRGQEGSEIKGFYAGWIREHVTDEQRRQRAIWGYIMVPARPPTDTPPLFTGAPLTSTTAGQSECEHISLAFDCSPTLNSVKLSQVTLHLLDSSAISPPSHHRMCLSPTWEREVSLFADCPEKQGQTYWLLHLCQSLVCSPKDRSWRHGRCFDFYQARPNNHTSVFHRKALI